jgi:hypothetical protein
MAVSEGYGEAMPQRLFVFMQLEFPWDLGPADGRYLLRSGPDAEPEHVVVIDTLDARKAGAELREARGPVGFLARRRGEAGRPASPEPAPVQTTRVTVIDPISLSAEQQARAWLDGLDREHEVRAAVATINRVLHYHRIASADPYIHEVSPAQTLVIRAGWGEGEQVSLGQWLHARELSLRPGRGMSRRRERSWALRPQERLAALMGGRSRVLLCEELTLRARLDMDSGRLAHAAVELDEALGAAVTELTAERRQDLLLRIAELEQLREGVAAQAKAALAGAEASIEGEVLGHALGRLEAALRARTATGFSLS